MEEPEKTATYSQAEEAMDHRRRKGLFTPEEVVQEFSAYFLDSERCTAWILRRLHPDGARCPGCGSPLTDRCLKTFEEGRRTKCGKCGKFFTARTDTFLSGTHMEDRKIILLALLLGLNQPVNSIAKMLGEDPETVRMWRKRFAMVERIRAISHE
jgi:transposase-like protein